MKKLILGFLMLSGCVGGVYAATVTAIDANNASVTDDLGRNNNYTSSQLNQIVTQDQVQMQKAGQQAQIADESYVQWGHTQQVWQNEVSTNNIGNATTL